VTDEKEEIGWSEGWKLFDSPESRRIDFQVKVIAVLEATLLVALICQVITATLLRWRWWAALLIPIELVLIFATGPPAHHPLTGIVRICLGPLLGSETITITASLLLGAEFADHFLMPRMYAVGRGGRLPSAREARRLRVEGVKQIRTRRAERLRTRFKANSS